MSLIGTWCFHCTKIVSVYTAIWFQLDHRLIQSLWLLLALKAGITTVGDPRIEDGGVHLIQTAKIRLEKKQLTSTDSKLLSKITLWKFGNVFWHSISWFLECLDLYFKLVFSCSCQRKMDPATQHSPAKSLDRPSHLAMPWLTNLTARWVDEQMADFKIS